MWCCRCRQCPGYCSVCSPSHQYCLHLRLPCWCCHCRGTVTGKKVSVCTAAVWCASLQACLVFRTGGEVTCKLPAKKAAQLAHLLLRIVCQVYFLNWSALSDSCQDIKHSEIWCPYLRPLIFKVVTASNQSSTFSWCRRSQSNAMLQRRAITELVNVPLIVCAGYRQDWWMWPGR